MKFKMEEVRLQKYLADSGICSRRKAEELILEGKIRVNGEIITKLGTKVILGKDEVIYNEKSYTKGAKNIYIIK